MLAIYVFTAWLVAVKVPVAQDNRATPPHPAWRYSACWNKLSTRCLSVRWSDSVGGLDGQGCRFL